jgi:group I intron endonuclease
MIIRMNKKFGIYKLTNLINKKIYIGKTNNLDRRLHEHQKSKNNQIIHKAIKKYNWNNFDIEILAEFEVVDNLELLALETAFIEYFKSLTSQWGYNVCLFSNDSSGIIRSEEFKEKIRKMNLGKRLSEEHKRKIGLSVKGCKHPHSLETIIKLSKPVKQIDKNTGKIIKIWSSATEACRSLDKGTSLICAVAGKKIVGGYIPKHAYGFIWEYVT